MTIELQVGKFYRARNGELFGPLKSTVMARYPYGALRFDGVEYAWTPFGQLLLGGEDPFDLVEEIPGVGEPGRLEALFGDTPAQRATDIAARAADLVGGDRDRQHGAKHDNFQRIAVAWQAWLDIRKDKSAPLTAHDVGCMMVAMKLARTQSGSTNPDDYVDACGYAACAGEIALSG